MKSPRGPIGWFVRYFRGSPARIVVWGVFLFILASIALNFIAMLSYIAKRGVP